MPGTGPDRSQLGGPNLEIFCDLITTLKLAQKVCTLFFDTLKGLRKGPQNRPPHPPGGVGGVGGSRL